MPLCPPSARWAPVISALFLLIFIVSAARANSCQNNAGNLNWSSAATWTSCGGVIPTAGDAVNIIAGSTVTVDITTAQTSTTTITGQLSFSRVSNSTLTVVGGNISVNAGGTLDMGSSGSPINASSATLVLAYGSTAGKYGLIVSAGGTFTVYGAAKTPMTTGVNHGGGNITNATTQVDVADATGWQNGDIVTIDTETATISSLTGNTFTITPVTLTHFSTNTIHVGALSRSVVVRSSGTSVSANTAYVQSLTSTGGFTAAYGEFAYLGSSLANKGGLTLKSNAINISSSTVHNGYNGIVLSSILNPVLGADLVFGNNQNGVLFTSASSGTVSGVYAIANVLNGFSDATSSNENYTNDFAYGQTNDGFILGHCASCAITGSEADNNTQVGIEIFITTGAAVNSNRASANGTGIELDTTCTADLVSGSTVYANTVGMDIACSTGALQANAIYANLYGVRVEAPATNDTLTANTISSNTIAGVQFFNASSQTLNGNTNYANGSYGLLLYASTGIVAMNGRLGYDASSGSHPDTGGEIFFDSTTAASNLTLENMSVNPAVGISTTGFSQAGSWLASYKDNGNAGAVKVYGDYQLSGSTLTLNYASALYAGSGDANAQKKLYLGPAASAYNNGRSKIEIDATGGFSAVGQSANANPTLIDMLPGGGTYYTFVDSGAFTIQYASMTNMDESGIQLNGSGPFSINNSIFDYQGSGVVSTSTLFTLFNVTNSTITLHNVTYGESRLNVYNYNFYVTGTTTGLHWTNQDYTGPLTGDAHEQQDSGNNIIWNPFSSGSFFTLFE